MIATIECRPAGPYLVKGLEVLADSAGAPIAHEDIVALCRCGGSATKPFCDGTHKKNGFSGERLADGSHDKRRSYAAPGITIHDNRSICAHAAHCTEGLAAVFREDARPWIDPAGAGVAEIIAAIRKCPSGALSYSIEGDERRREPGAARITLTKDGPYAVEGAELTGVAFAQGATPTHYTLCRCGASMNKPFCDGSHWEAGFTDGR